MLIEPLRAFAPRFGKFDPAGVEPVDHLHAGCWILHALGAKEDSIGRAARLPRALAARAPLANALAKASGDTRCAASNSTTSPSFPRLLKERSSGPADVIRGDHRDGMIQGLKVGRDCSFRAEAMSHAAFS